MYNKRRLELSMLEFGFRINYAKLLHSEFCFTGINCVRHSFSYIFSYVEAKLVLPISDTLSEVTASNSKELVIINMYYF